MNLKKVDIINFKSIKRTVINFDLKDDSQCYTLLGINESGKSNILEALSFLDDTNINSNITYNKVCHKPSQENDEEVIIEYSFMGDFNSIFDLNSINNIPDEVKSKIKIIGISKHVEIYYDDSIGQGTTVNIKDYVLFKSYVYDTSTKSIKKLSDICSDLGLLKSEVNNKNIKEKLGSTYAFLSKYYLSNILKSNFKEQINNLIPKVIYWKAKPEYLINAPINLVNFISNPSISRPLKNIFNISGYNELNSIIEKIKRNDEERIYVEKQLTERSTKYLNEVWQDHPVNIYVRIENDLTCKVSVEDKSNTKAKYLMNQRSDGFQQFISILLNLSIENETNKLENTLILLDEPEIHLHPSGAKYLRNELLKIGENNTLLIATHSIYLVDKNTINRHYSVKKEIAETEISQIEKNPYTEEVLYEALGTSILEHINKNVILFEGTTDKDIFDSFNKRFKKELSPKNITSISSDGVGNIRKYAKFFNNNIIKGYILVDSDNDGIREKDFVKKDIKSYNTRNTFEINDIIKTNKKSTLEDLFPKEIIEDIIFNQYKQTIILDPCTPYIEQVQQLNKKLSGKINIKDLKSKVTSFVLNEVNSNITKDSIEKKYSLYLSFAKKLNSKIK